jgi:outer membrane protein assembly factor BamE (lipoprotein component of BamABCDE complex)
MRRPVRALPAEIAVHSGVPTGGLRMAFRVAAFKGIAVGTVLAAAAIAMAGCLVSSQSHESFTGTQVSESTFGQIRTGVTTRQWVEATLGQPTMKTTLDDGGEVWKWSYSKVKQSSGAILFVFGGSSTTTTGGAAYVEFGPDGIVRRAWRAE